MLYKQTKNETAPPIVDQLGEENSMDWKGGGQGRGG